MPSAFASSLGIVAYLALFAGIGVVFLFVNLLVGRLVRPHDPHPEKTEIYECGEPTIGSSFVQFDLRFYVVALLFIIFDVEAALFYPWAIVFGKANQFTDSRMVVVADGQLTPAAVGLYREMGIRDPQPPRAVPASLRTSVGGEQIVTQGQAEQVIRGGARQLALLTVVDILAFFTLLMVGFAYVWRKGDLDWVRAASQQRAATRPPDAAPIAPENEPALTA